MSLGKQMNIEEIQRNFNLISIAMSEITVNIPLKENKVQQLALVDVTTSPSQQQAISDNFKKIEAFINAIIMSLELKDPLDYNAFISEGFEFSSNLKTGRLSKTANGVRVYYDDATVIIEDNVSVAIRDQAPSIIEKA